MTRYFGRQYRIEFADDSGTVQRVIDSRESLTPLQIEFFTETTFGAALSLMELSISGLSKASIGQIVACKTVDLQAGYPDAFGSIFVGKITNHATPRDDVDRELTLYCWSGLKEQTDKTCNVSFAEGSKYADIVDFIARDIFQRPPAYIGFSEAFKQAMGTASDGYNGNQSHRVFLDHLAADLQFQWLIQNERCVLMERGTSRGGDAWPINAETGLVGGVSLTWLGADFEMKLNPKINIGDRVNIRSESTSINFSSIYSVSLPKHKSTIGDGDYVVKALRRQGSFYGDNSWTSELTCWREGETGLREDGLPYVQ